MPSRTRKPLFEIRSSVIQGAGAFALRPIRKGTRLIEYLGERGEPPGAGYDDADGPGFSHVVLFTVDKRTVIDAGVGGNDARFFNHSCAPNCAAVIENRRIFLDALRNIGAGEELTYDYEMQRDNEDDETARRLYPCRCGTSQCRGTLLAPLPAPRQNTARRRTATKRRTQRAT